MPVSLSPNQLRLLRLRAQRLTSNPPENAPGVAGVVKALGGLQAQELPAAGLSVRARSAGLVAAGVEKARVEDRTVIRTWGQRSTLHLLATEDLGWLLPLLGPAFRAASRTRRAELGLDEATSAGGSRLLRQVLADSGPLTRAEIVEQLAGKGLRLEGQAIPHLIGYAALEGTLCHGPEREGEPSYVLLDDWVPGWQTSAISAEAAYSELVLRYLAAYGPAEPEDLASWSGLAMREIKAAWKHLAGQLVEVEVANRPLWLQKTNQGWLEELATGPSPVRLLPRYDTYLLGYRSRELILEARYAKRVNAGGGIVHPTLLVGGRIAATWKSQKRKNRLEIAVAPFEKLDPAALPGLEAEIKDLARFGGVETKLVLEEPE